MMAFVGRGAVARYGSFAPGTASPSGLSSRASLTTVCPSCCCSSASRSWTSCCSWSRGTSSSCWWWRPRCSLQEVMVRLHVLLLVLGGCDSLVRLVGALVCWRRRQDPGGCSWGSSTDAPACEHENLGPYVPPQTRLQR